MTRLLTNASDATAPRTAATATCQRSPGPIGTRDPVAVERVSCRRREVERANRHQRQLVVVVAHLPVPAARMNTSIARNQLSTMARRGTRRHSRMPIADSASPGGVRCRSQSREIIVS